MNRSISYLVAINDGTDKVRFAKKYRIPIVKPSWLYDCFSCFKRLNVDAYILPTVADDEPIVENVTLSKRIRFEIEEELISSDDEQETFEHRKRQRDISSDTEGSGEIFSLLEEEFNNAEW
jgi:hypothetical protein